MSIPAVPPMASWTQEAPPAPRPGGLTVICIIAIVLGGLGLLNAPMAIVNLVAGQRIQQALAFTPPGPGQNQMAEMQRLMQEKMMAVTNRYWWPLMGFAVLNLGLSMGLLVGGIMALKRAPQARTLLVVVFAVTILFELVQCGVNVMVQSKMAAVMSEMLPQVMAASAPPNRPGAQQAANMGQAVAKMSIIAGIAVQVIWTLAKLVYYGIGWSYLGRSHVRAWLERRDEAAAAAIVL